MLKRLALAGAALLPALGASAQDYPTRAVTMIVPYAAGGPDGHRRARARAGDDQADGPDRGGGEQARAPAASSAPRR